MAGIHWITELFPPDDDDTTPFNVPEMFRAHNAVKTVVMLTPNGNVAGEVMVDSIAHRYLLAAGYTEAQS